MQILLGVPARLTLSIFAYSMLYPVTDNFLDAPKRGLNEKLEFNQHFFNRLLGNSIHPINDHEEKVFRLIQMFESEFDREIYPQVYESLLAIFKAQQASLMMPKFPASSKSVDALGISLSKGGTSVLVDGFLAKGILKPEQMESIFDYGCFAQFMDDQEDVEIDLKDGSNTVFTEAVRNGKLDLVLNHLFGYSRVILKGLDLFVTERSSPLIKVSLKGINLLLIDACVRNRKYYSNPHSTSINQKTDKMHGFDLKT